MKRLGILSFYMFIGLLLMGLASCGSDNDDDKIIPEEKAENTVFVYFPWTGSNSPLTENFKQNLSDIKEAIVSRGGLGKTDLIVFMSKDMTHGSLYKIKYKNGNCVDEPLRDYENNGDMALNKTHWITYIMNQVKSFAPAQTYSMIIGSHGWGWIDEADWNAYGAKGFSLQDDDDTRAVQGVVTKMQGHKLTSFGGTQIKTNISTLADGIAAAGIKMQYILFDDCNMSNVETAYDLKDVTDYMIACPTEIMAYGMPYTKIWGQLSSKTPDYKNICDEFYNFYTNYQYPYGTIAVTKTAELDELASIMLEIDTIYTFNNAERGNLQTMDGYTPTIFFDYGDYVEHLCQDAALLSKFKTQLAKAVPYKSATARYYTALSSPSVRVINSYSGLTISWPSVNARIVGKNATAFYLATHKN